MPPSVGPNKSKSREGRQSLSRHTTPSSSVSAQTSVMSSSNTEYLNIPLSKFMVPSNISYEKILERHGGGGGIPDPTHLQTMAEDLKALSRLAETRSQALDEGMRELVLRRKERAEEERREAEEAARELEEKERLRKAAEEEEDIRARKGATLKKKNERNSKVEERPLTHGAHGVARQDGLVDMPSQAPTSAPEMERKPPHNTTSGKRSRDEQTLIRDYMEKLTLLRFTLAEAEHIANQLEDPAAARKASLEVTSNAKRKLDDPESSSSLSPPSQLASQLASPAGVAGTAANGAQSARASSPTSSTSSIDEHQPPPAPSMPQYQTFGPDPSKFDDPTIYHIREVTDDMTDEEKRDIYGVRSFPKSDLSDLIAGKVADKDFSNAKPTNQVNANTFLAYVEPYLRPLTEEDMAWLKERGDRVGPFITPPRGKRSYKEIWAEEDGQVSIDGNHSAERLPPNQARGSLEDMDDETAETDQVSNGPMMNRLLSCMRFEHRMSPTDEKEKPNGVTNGINGDINMNGTDTADTVNATSEEKSLPSATAIPENALPASARNPSNAPKLNGVEMDERLKQELRFIGFIGQDAEPDYEGHFDDEVAERLRMLQAELKEVSIINGAKKARIEKLAKDRMAHQEYSTILDDLNNQVQGQWLKSSRGANKKKNPPKTKAGGAGGGSHPIAVGNSRASVARSTISDQTRQLMTRREKWANQIGPIFDEEITKVRTEGDSIFTDDIMEPLIRAERERWDEEAE